MITLEKVSQDTAVAHTHQFINYLYRHHPDVVKAVPFFSDKDLPQAQAALQTGGTGEHRLLGNYLQAASKIRNSAGRERYFELEKKFIQQNAERLAGQARPAIKKRVAEFFPHAPNTAAVEALFENILMTPALLRDKAAIEQCKSLKPDEQAIDQFISQLQAKYATQHVSRKTARLQRRFERDYAHMPDYIKEYADTQDLAIVVSGEMLGTSRINSYQGFSEYMGTKLMHGQNDRREGRLFINGSRHASGTLMEELLHGWDHCKQQVSDSPEFQDAFDKDMKSKPLKRVLYGLVTSRNGWGLGVDKHEEPSEALAHVARLQEQPMTCSRLPAGCHKAVKHIGHKLSHLLYPNMSSVYEQAAATYKTERQEARAR